MPKKKITAQTGELPQGGRFITYFFGTIVVLFIITAILLTFAHIQTPSEELITAERERVYELINKYTEQALGESFPDTEINIDKQVDIAFAPAYQNIKVFADAHYTVKGEYTELFFAATGRLEEEIQAVLFDGLQERLDVGWGFISASFMDELADNFKAEAKDHRAMSLVIDDMHGRFKGADLALKSSMAAGGGAVGVMTAKTISAAIAKKLFAVAAAKTAGKTTAKFAFVGTGAAIGSVIPGAGTAVGAVIGGVIGWFAVDKAVVEVDEYFNRADFEKELASLIDEQKALVKSRIRKHINDMVIDVKNKSPLELIRGDS